MKYRRIQFYESLGNDFGNCINVSDAIDEVGKIVDLYFK